MTSSPSLRLKVGERIWYDGQAWTVREVGSQAADLVDSVGTQRRAALTDLVGAATNIVEESTPPTLGDDLSAIHLSQLTTAQRRQVEREYELLLPLMQKPVTPEELEAAASAQGMSTRTLRRRLDRATEFQPPRHSPPGAFPKARSIRAMPAWTPRARGRACSSSGCPRASRRRTASTSTFALRQD